MHAWHHPLSTNFRQVLRAFLLPCLLPAMYRCATTVVLLHIPSRADSTIRHACKPERNKHTASAWCYPSANKKENWVRARQSKTKHENEPAKSRGPNNRTTSALAHTVIVLSLDPRCPKQASLLTIPCGGSSPVVGKVTLSADRVHSYLPALHGATCSHATQKIVCPPSVVGRVR